MNASSWLPSATLAVWGSSLAAATAAAGGAAAGAPAAAAGGAAAGAPAAAAGGAAAGGVGRVDDGRRRRPRPIVQLAGEGRELRWQPAASRQQAGRQAAAVETGGGRGVHAGAFSSVPTAGGNDDGLEGTHGQWGRRAIDDVGMWRCMYSAEANPIASSSLPACLPVGAGRVALRKERRRSIRSD
eukprot:GHVU01132426.1.p1 GENE.GHVU01132426.1~~GHVU01132426.1.p1  ORF type:complete len:185 (+),score=47.28 GHVU01132426.1:171-725(+)